MTVLRHLLLAWLAAAPLAAQVAPETAPVEPAVAPPAATPAPPPEDPRDAAKREAWTSAVLIVSLLEQGDNRAFPGILAWLADFRQVAATTPLPESGKPFPQVDADALVTRNPHFWSAFYEVQRGDPGLALLHAALLLSGGEAQRAAAIAAFGLQRPGAPEEIKRALHSLIAQCSAAQARSMELVRLGVRLHDMGEFQTAVKQFDEALREWPANGSAHYERGSSLRMQAIAEARRSGEKASADEPVADPPETLAAFASARRHDPLHLLSYQGDDATIKTALIALVNSGLPIWDAIRRKPDVPVRADALRTFSEACREAGADDFALVLRQLFVATKRHYGEDDAELIRVCLHRIAPAAMIEPLLSRVSGETRLPTRQIVVPTIAETADLAKNDEVPAKADTGKMAKGKGRVSKSADSPVSHKKKRATADSDDAPAKTKSKSAASGRKRKS